MIDSSCDIWQDQCGEKGSCWVYNQSELALRICLLTVAFKVASLTFHSLALFLYKAPKDEKSGNIEMVEQDDSRDNPGYDDKNE